MHSILLVENRGILLLPVVESLVKQCQQVCTNPVYSKVAFKV